MPRAALAFTLTTLLLADTAAAQQTEIRHLSGTDKDHTVDWEFMVTGGRQANSWSKIPVPSHWEQHGFGNYNYGHDGTKRFPDKIRHQEKGLYRHRFQVPAAWRGRSVRIVFEGSMTDTEVKINGESAGPIHQGAFYRFKHDISQRLRYGEENLLEVTVAKQSANASVNEAERTADFWIFGGIFRPVYLEALPAAHVDRLAIDARHDGRFSADVFVGGVQGPARLTARILGSGGRPVGAPFAANVPAGAEKVTLSTKVTRPRTWSAEFPHLHQVEISLQQKGRTVHRVRETFGFRTVELRRHDGLYVNGVKVRLKGVNRHTFWPDSGRVSSPELSEKDVLLIKSMNMNAVRMSHYPPDTHFLDAADRLGLFVLDELTGWQDAYDTQVGEQMVRELVTRDVNHPSILFWNNGNEGGFNFDLDDDYARWDPQKRVVLHPWSNFNGVDTGHDEAYGCCANSFFGGDEVVMPTEFLHGLYDGGHGAGLADWWDKMLRHPRSAGGFLWAFADEAIRRTDRGGALDTDGNHGPDGILGPYREKEGSYFAIREIWSPVFLEMGTQDRLPATFDGRLRVENRYHFTDLAQVTFSYQLIDFTGPERVVRDAGKVPSPQVAPQATGWITLPLPATWRQRDALALSAVDPHGREIFTWTWMLREPAAFAERLVNGRPAAGDVQVTETAARLVLQRGLARLEFDRGTGRLMQVSIGNRALGLGNGPRLVNETAPGKLAGLQQRRDGADVVVEATYASGRSAAPRWRWLANGWLRLDYAYDAKKGDYPYLGATFDGPSPVQGMTWLGRGPYRVWKNRTRGVGFGVWKKSANDTVTGVSWEYPEFKGFHADLHWARLDTAAGPLTIASATKDVYLRVGTPAFPTTPMHAQVKFPAGDLSFLQGIAPIGTKFRPPREHGPEGDANIVARHGMTYETTLFFQFGE